MEEVFGIERIKIIDLLKSCPKGFISADISIIKTFTHLGSFNKRTEAEINPNFKQLIPYLIIKNQNNFLLYQRLKAQSESRLHNLFSLGIGGHINKQDQNKSSSIIMAGLYRELNEELNLQNDYTLCFKGLINDDSSEVGKVHLGLCFLLETASEIISTKESLKMKINWLRLNEITNYFSQLESWSQIVYSKLLTKLNP